MTPVTVRCSACGFVASGRSLNAASVAYTDHCEAVHPIVRDTPPTVDALRQLVSVMQARRHR